jgi:hypothetical protein
VRIDTDATKQRDLLLAESETITLAPWSLVVLQRQADELTELEAATDPDAPSADRRPRKTQPPGPISRRKP